MLTLAYDTLDYAADRRALRMRPNGAAVAAAPAGGVPAWLLRFSLLAPERLGFERTETLVRDGRPFVYPLELTTDSRPGAPRPPHPVIVALPEPVRAAARAGRAGVVVWLGEVAAPPELDADAHVWLFDLVELVALQNEIPPRAVWFVTGTVNARQDLGEWQRLRGFYRPELFHLRALSIFPGLARATFHANAAGRAVTHAGGPDGMVTLATVALDEAAFRARYPAPEALAAESRAGTVRACKLTYASTSAAPHHRCVLALLAALGALEATAARFPAHAGDPDFAAMLAGAPDVAARLEAAWRAVARRLPLRDAGDPHRLGYVALAGEPAFHGYPLADAGVLGPVLDLQPFVWIGSPDTLRYLRALGFKTFGHVIDERYDAPDPTAARLIRLLGQIEALAGHDRAALRELRDACLPTLLHNRAHLLEGRHQLDALLAELEAAYGD